MTYRHRIFALLPAVILVGSIAGAAPDGADRIAPQDRESIGARLAELDVPFIENRGETDPRALYYTHTFGGDIFVTEGGDIVYAIPKGKARLALRERFVGGDGAATPRGDGEGAVRVHNFRGGARAGGPVSFAAVDLGAIYDGIDIRLEARGRNVEKVFTVQPGADAARIRIRMEGAGALAVREGGVLSAPTEMGDVTFTRPVAWQETDGRKENVEVAYRVDGDTYGFAVGAYDRSRPLVIDPLLSSTFLGGSDVDGMTSGLVLDDSGDIYVAAMCASPDFPTVYGGADTTWNGGSDVFVAKLSGDLTTLIACTFLGGSGLDGQWPGPNLARDSSGVIYVSGQTESADFPFTSGAADSTFGGDTDIFVAKLSADLSTLLACTYVGGSANDFTEGIQVAANGDVWIAGNSSSSDYPTTAGVWSETYLGPVGAYNGDGVITRLAGDLTTVTASTYFGGEGTDAISEFVLDPGGSIYVAGYTWTGQNFPTTPDAYDTTYHGAGDSFAARFDTSLTTLLASTLLGGAGEWDIAIAITRDPANGDIYLTGHTASSTFPATPGAYDTTYNSYLLSDAGDDVFIARFDADLEELIAATYLGGRKWESPCAVILDGTGYLYITGSTSSRNFPTTAGAYDTEYGAGGTTQYSGDLFVCRMTTDLNTLAASTFLGGSGGEFYGYMALDPDGNVVVAASTADSTTNDFPVTTGAYDETYNGGVHDYAGDVVVCKLDPLLQDPCVSVDGGAPDRGAFLFENRPNPFNPVTTIHFALPEAAPVRLSVHDAAGRLVRTLADGAFSAGPHALRWDGADRNGRPVASGIYFSRLASKKFIQTRKMVLLR
ncbi:MAG: hypothetical protein JW958_14570 [Candidatus Eisenbacteria bacterium]|nr:hypothetical protein [Candidatus Eisenbacteria bacterium]